VIHRNAASISYRIASVKILLVDDDDAFRQHMAEQLKLYEEFIVHQAGSGAAALAATKGESFDAVLLDIGLPDMDGREVCRLIRRTGIVAPILMVTAAATDADTILAFEAGASDYLIKPFSLGVLLARLRAHLRQHQDSLDAVFTIGRFEFQPSAKLLVHRETNRKLWLTLKESQILKRLYQSRNKVVSRKTLLEEVWGYHAEISTHTLETHVYRLRSDAGASGRGASGRRSQRAARARRRGNI